MQSQVPLPHLCELLHLSSPSHSLRSLTDTRMLKLQHFNRKTHGFRTISHFGRHTRNNLPQDIRHPSFKSKLKTFSSQNISAKQHCPSPTISLYSLCVRVCIFSKVTLEPLCTLCVSYFLCSLIHIRPFMSHIKSNTQLWAKKGNFIHKVPDIKQLNNWWSCFHCVQFCALCTCLGGTTPTLLTTAHMYPHVI